MSWSWSHSLIGIEHCRDNLYRLPRAELVQLYAEWKAYHSAKAKDAEDHEPFDAVEWKRVLASEGSLVAGMGIPTDIMADCVWEWMEEQALCDVGGYRAWACPYGCGCHTLSFDEAAD